MASYRIPDHVVCLGGGGTEFGEKFLEQDWILEELIRNNPRGEAAPDTTSSDKLKTYLVDTDKTSLPSDDWLHSTVKETVSRMEDKYGENYDADIEAETINIPEEMNDKYLRAEHVTAPSHIKELASDLGLKAWWIEDDPENRIIGPLDGLKQGGVKRLRALTKAIVRLSEYDSDPFERIIESVQTTNDSNVAIVVGLGGGTGSGSLIDLTKRIRDAGAQVTLFGILPAPSGEDGSDVLANAYATLSELEYLALSKVGLFKNRILVPYDPSVNDDNFDKSLCYTLLSYYNMNDNQANTYNYLDETKEIGPPEFAPFTIGTTRYLHYSKGDVDKLRDKFKEFRNLKEERITIEKNLYEAIEDFIETNYEKESEYLWDVSTQPDEFKLSNQKALTLEARINTLEGMLNKSIMKELNFKSADSLSHLITDVKSDSEEIAEWDDERDKSAAVARDFIYRLANTVNPDNVSQFEPTNQKWETGEREFVKDVCREFQLIAQRAGIIQAINAIEEKDTERDEVTAVDLRTAISPDDSGHAAGAENIKDQFDEELSEINTKINQYENVIENAKKAISQGYSDEQGLINRFEDSSGDSIRRYYELTEDQPEIESLLDDLKDEIETTVGRLINKQNSENIQIQGTKFNDYGKLNEKLKKFDVDSVDEVSIESTVKSVQKARKKQLEANEQQGSLKNKVTSVIGSSPIKGLKSDYQGLKNREINQDIISISDWSSAFDITVHDNYFSMRRKQLSNEKEELVTKINKATEDILSTTKSLKNDPNKWLASEPSNVIEIAENVDNVIETKNRTFLTNYLQDNSICEEFKNAEELLNGGVEEKLREAIGEILIDPYEEKREKLAEQRDMKKERKNKFGSLENIVKNYGQDYYSITDETIDILKTLESEDIDNSGNFRIDAKPHDRGRLSKSSDLSETPLLSSKEGHERKLTLSKLENITPNLGGDYLPVKERYIIDDDSKQVDYDYYRIDSVFSSRLFDEYDDDEGAMINDIKEHFVGLDALGEKTGDNEGREYYATRSNFADSYDLATSTFLTGIFLDNLELFADTCNEIYLDSNDIEKENDSNYHHQKAVPKQVKHHTYGIDGITYHDYGEFLPDESDGGYIYRDEVMNFNVDGAEKLLDHGDEEGSNWDEEVRKMILEDYYSHVGYPSTIDLE